MTQRIRTVWRVCQRYRRAADLLTLVGALAGVLAVLLAGSAAMDGASWLDRDVLVSTGLAACAGGLGMRLLVRCVWRAHRRLRAEQWA
jgi:hypothetical protein